MTNTNAPPTRGHTHTHDTKEAGGLTYLFVLATAEVAATLRGTVVGLFFLSHYLGLEKYRPKHAVRYAA